MYPRSILIIENQSKWHRNFLWVTYSKKKVVFFHATYFETFPLHDEFLRKHVLYLSLLLAFLLINQAHLKSASITFFIPSFFELFNPLKNPLLLSNLDCRILNLYIFWFLHYSCFLFHFSYSSYLHLYFSSSNLTVHCRISP